MGTTTCDIFISYRRRTAGFAAEIIYKKINEKLAGRVFMDTKVIKPGERFPDKLKDKLKQCRVFLVLIDNSWHDAWNGNNFASKNDKQDWLLREIESVLNRKIPILPILLDDAKIPEGSDLPESIKKLKELDEFQVRQKYVETDVKLLLEHIFSLLNGGDNNSIQPINNKQIDNRRTSRGSKIFAVLLVVSLISAIFYQLSMEPDVDSLEDKLFRDCKICPEMVVLEFQPFQMGSDSETPNERPVREVNLTGRFALSTHEIKWSEWNVCVDDGHCPPIHVMQPEPGQPVSGVSWKEAASFAHWLSKKTNKTYRLPSEVEWEFAARLKNAAGYDDLYHMIGNVWEWVSDCGLPYQSDVQTANPVVDPRGCTQRVLRGGSWKGRPSEVTVSSRKIVPLNARASDYGFRVAQSMQNLTSKSRGKHYE